MGETRKIVINRCYGGFSLSPKAISELKALGWTPGQHDTVAREIPRDDPRLVEVVERLGKKADGRYAALEVYEIPLDVEWEVDEYDGIEWIAEKHRRWG